MCGGATELIQPLGAVLALSLSVSTGHPWVWLTSLSLGTITAQLSLASWPFSVSALSVTCPPALQWCPCGRPAPGYPRFSAVGTEEHWVFSGHMKASGEADRFTWAHFIFPSVDGKQPKELLSL